MNVRKEKRRRRKALLKFLCEEKSTIHPHNFGLLSRSGFAR